MDDEDTSSHVFDDAPHPIDIHVGSRVRLRRTILRMTKIELSQALCIGFRQLQKYERGTKPDQREPAV